jgi:hypothetical protein
MTVALNQSIRLVPPRDDTRPVEPGAPAAPASPRPRGTRLRSVAKFIWHALVIAFSGPGLDEYDTGIDDSAMPSSFQAPYKNGSRQIRSLWHEPF